MDQRLQAEEEHGSKLLSKSSKAKKYKEISLLWENLSYVVHNKDRWKDLTNGKVMDALRRREYVVLKRQSGYIGTGSLTAVLGKSGCGKTSLIESLAGRRTRGLTGNIFITVKSDNAGFKARAVNVSLIPQQDHLSDALTVEESLRFASRLKNIYKSSKYHEEMVNDLINRLDLHTCRGVYTSSCSGGQRKRLSIAMELVSKPTVLVLDEPTSGLDSLSASECVKMLKNLTKTTNPLAIIASIHQPSAKLLSVFDKLYLLSHDGRCLFFDDVPCLLDHFRKYQLECPEYYNPAEYAVRIACGEYGEEVINKLESDQAAKASAPLSVLEQSKKFSIKTITQQAKKKPLSTFFGHTYILFIRTVLTTMRDPVLNLCRLLPHIFIALIVGSMYENAVGQENGCVPLTGIVSFDAIIEKRSLTRQNVGLLFFSVLFLSFASMVPTVAVFPLEMSAFLKERTNGWYSCMSYYFAKTLADIPFQIVYTTLYVAITYYLTDQIPSMWRFLTVLFVFLIVSAIGQSYGLLFGAIFCNHINAAILVAIGSTSGFLLLSGFIVRVTTLATYLQPLTYMSHMRYAFEAVIISIYGYERCESQTDNATLALAETCSTVFQLFKKLQALNISYSSLRPLLQSYVEMVDVPMQGQPVIDDQISTLGGVDFDWHEAIANQTHKSVSVVMKEFELNDRHLYLDILILLLMLVLFRCLTYVIFLSKANTRK